MPERACRSINFPISVNNDDLSARFSHSYHFSQRLLRPLQVHKQPLAATTVEGIIAKGQNFRISLNKASFRSSGPASILSKACFNMVAS